MDHTNTSVEQEGSLFLRSEDAPTLSLAMIVKNEADTLERCLRPALPHVDEIVIVDTGSTDGTRKIARRYADVYDEIEWPGSFSEARNHSYDLATEDYILVLDGDEYIPNPFHWELIRKSIAQPKVGLVQLRLHNILPDDSLVGASEIWHERIVPNHPEVRWEGKVHNQIAHSINRFMRRNGLRAVKSEAVIVHTGYAMEAEDKREKYQERLPLLEAEYEDPKSAVSRAYYGFQLGLVYVVMGEYEKAYQVLHHLDYELMNDVNGFYAHYLATRSCLGTERLDDALDHCEGMLRITREEPVAFFTLAHILMHTGQIYEGILTFIEAYRVNEEVDRARFQMNREFLLESLRDLFSQATFSEDAYRVLRAYVRDQGESPATKKLHEVFDEAAAQAA